MILLRFVIMENKKVGSMIWYSFLGFRRSFQYFLKYIFTVVCSIYILLHNFYLLLYDKSIFCTIWDGTNEKYSGLRRLRLGILGVYKKIFLYLPKIDVIWDQIIFLQWFTCVNMEKTKIYIFYVQSRVLIERTKNLNYD